MLHPIIEACLCNARIVSGGAGEASDTGLYAVLGGQAAIVAVGGTWLVRRFRKRRQQG
jgi:hypothetical protein